jgi:hypothetical protein
MLQILVQLVRRGQLVKLVILALKVFRVYQEPLQRQDQQELKGQQVIQALRV